MDLLLDSEASGICRIEREGVSRTYPARFVLVGTMNPEERTLRPQLLDRFGLSVKVTGSLTKEERLLLVRRQIAWEDDPEAFAASFAEAEEAYRDRIREASVRYRKVAFSDAMAEFSAGILNEIGPEASGNAGRRSGQRRGGIAEKGTRRCSVYGEN